jgi:hypothetical protein
MTQPDQTGPPTWYNEPPEWVKQLNQRPPSSAPPSSRPPGYEAGRQDQELLTAIRSMPDQVVNALRSAIEAATPQQKAPENQQQQQKAPEPQQQQQQEQNNQVGDNPPNHGETFADKWFGNKLFT